MLLLTWLISMLATAALAYHYRELVTWVEELSLKITEAGKTEPTAPTASLVDLDDPILRAKYEYKERMEKLNPHIYDKKPND